MAVASSSKTAVDTETSQEDYVWLKLKLLQSIVVQSRLGQTILKLVDNFLWVVEKCTEWSLPRLEVNGGENRKDSRKPELVRPLPWILFLPSLVLLRVIRVTVSIGASALGYPQITPSGMVKFVQICRRYLNAGMNKGMKERYETKDKRPSINEAKKALIRSIRLTLSSLSCLDASKPSLSPPPTKIHVSSILDPDPVIKEEKSVTTEKNTVITEEIAVTTGEETVTREEISVATEEKSVTTEKKSEEKSATESMGSSPKLKAATSESEEEGQKESLNEKIDRLALEDSEDDEDFNVSDLPKSCFSNKTSDEDSDKTSDEDNDKTSDEDSDENCDTMSPTELSDVINEAKEFRKVLEDMDQFLNREKISTSTPEQETVEPVSGKRSLIKESRDKVEERLATSQRIDSPECYTPDRSSQEGDPTFYSPISSDSDAPKEVSVPSIAEQRAPRETVKKLTNEFINGEVRFISDQSASTISESKSPGVTNNGAMVQKRATNVSKCHKGKRTSHGNRKKK